MKEDTDGISSSGTPLQGCGASGDNLIDIAEPGEAANLSYLFFFCFFSAIDCLSETFMKNLANP
jgi:hypothetical protein